MVLETLRNTNYIMKGKNMKNLNATQTEQVEALFKHYGRVEVSRSEINNFVKSGEISNPSWLKNDKYKFLVEFIRCRLRATISHQHKLMFH